MRPDGHAEGKGSAAVVGIVEDKKLTSGSQNVLAQAECRPGEARGPDSQPLLDVLEANHTGRGSGRSTMRMSASEASLSLPAPRMLSSVGVSVPKSGVPRAVAT